MTLYKLYTHTKSYSDADLLLNTRDSTEAKLGDVVEIYHHEEETGPRLLLQITKFNDLKARDSISIDSAIATQFNLKTFNDVVMRVVNASDVALDSIELTFKDQYMGRSEMWRMKTYLTNTCVYINKKIEFKDVQTRCQVYEMWSQGERVACGVITEDTKIVFRSSTSMVYLFLQMSSEMWEFDIHGDLYFEKAVNGFLTELFHKWKKLGCNHEVTIVLFSRTFYAAKCLDEFPEHMRDCLQMDYKGRFYEDFYRVAIQNERNDDWCTVLPHLRKLLTCYQDTVLRFHERDGLIIPKATNSTAQRGNFLEVLNISLNTFEKHYLDRTFDRTGQLSVVITPGVGVFEVDRELTNITKQRIIDNGVGSDLVCVGEQPLHAVPLLKFHNKDTSLTVADDFSLPHWINLSFYSTNKKVAYSNFIPRIKLPTNIAEAIDKDENEQYEKNFLSCDQSEYIHNSLFDYDAYDEQIFQLPPAQGTCSLQRVVRAKKTSVPSLETYAYNNSDWESFTSSNIPSLRRKMSDPDIHHGTSGMLAALADSSLSESLTATEKMSRRTIVSVAPIVRPGRALINPFDPTHVTIKLTSNRRRWTHIFPKGPTGVLIQQHHYQAIPTRGHAAPTLSNTAQYCGPANEALDYEQTSMSSALSRLCAGSELTTENTNKRSFLTCNGIVGAVVPKAKSFLWGATGEQEWTPALTTDKKPADKLKPTIGKQLKQIVEREQHILPFESNVCCCLDAHLNACKHMTNTDTDPPRARGRVIIGVDWKSLTITACLPITTDYFPDKRSLHNDYVITDYTLLPDDVNYEYALHRAVYRRPLSADVVYKEIISQRLAQGFQLIVLEDKDKEQKHNQSLTSNTQYGGTPTMEITLHNGILLANTPPKALSLWGNHQIQHHNHQQQYQQQQQQQQQQHHQHQQIIVQTKTNSHNLSSQSSCNAELHEECFLSIGRIFHRITLKGNVITVTGYRPRHPYPPINFDYRYRFYAPQHESYEISGVNFTTEKLEKFNWNYMDHYVSTRGDRDYPLVESLKYWRYRMYLLPRENQTIEVGGQHCDIYTDTAVDNTKQQVDDFLRFLETHLNKLKRQNSRRARDSPTAQSHLTRRRHSTSIISRPPNQGLTNSPFRERVGSNRLPEKRPSISTRPVPRFVRGRISPAADVAAITLSNESPSREDTDDGFLVEVRLRPNATLQEIFEAMSHPVTGVGFLITTQGLPSCTFVSWDALLWLKSHLENAARNPLEILEAMRREKLICHASGDWNKPVLPGFMLYYIAKQDTSSKDFVQPLNSLEVFESEWVEVEIQGCNHLWMDEPSVPPVPNFLREQPTPQTWHDNTKKKKIYRHCHLEIDATQKSNRMEWGHVKYHTIMQPGFAFELVVEWLTASGPIVYDLIYGWIRKANQCNYQLISVPADPMAEPYTEKSDPLRAPIFIALTTDFLPNGMTLFEEFSEDSRADRMLLFQEAILARFGFLPCVLERKDDDAPKEYQYVHCSGNMFVLIRCSKNYMPIESPSRKEANVTRYVYGHTHNTNVPKKVGFLWAWNHMIPNKKWKSLTINNMPDGELFQLKMLKDFREFCANSDNRLSKFYQHCQDLKYKYSKNESMMQNGVQFYRNNQQSQQLEQQQQQPLLNNDTEQHSIAQLVLNYTNNNNNNNNSNNNGLFNFSNYNGQPQQKQQQPLNSNNNN